MPGGIATRRDGRIEERCLNERALSRPDGSGDDLRGRAIRGGAVTLGAQASRFGLQLASTVILSRLLLPSDFGLIAMITAITGFVELFGDLGLSAATVQREQMNDQQLSTLFWINVTCGILLSGVGAAFAPGIAWFYGDSRLIPLTTALATGFALAGLGVQHQAILRRRMQFRALAWVDVASNALGVGAGIGAALAGWGVWSLVAQRLVASASSSSGAWLACRWRPALRFATGGIRSLLVFGGHLTGFNALNYLMRNADNVLIGRWWGAADLGIYGRAYQLLLLPIQQINAPISSVALPTLSRLQGDPERFRSFYLRALDLLASITMPAVVAMSVLSEALVEVLLGERWSQVAVVFRLLSGAVIVQSTCNTTGWLYVATGRTDRMLRWGIGASVLLLSSFVVGIPYGVTGVATAYSVAMLAQTIPCLWFATRGTRITLYDIGRSVLPATVSAFGAGAATLAIDIGFREALGSGERLCVGAVAFGATYAIGLLLVFRRGPVFRMIVSEMRVARK